MLFSFVKRTEIETKVTNRLVLHEDALLLDGNPQLQLIKLGCLLISNFQEQRFSPASYRYVRDLLLLGRDYLLVVKLCDDDNIGLISFIDIQIFSLLDEDVY